MLKVRALLALSLIAGVAAPAVAASAGAAARKHRSRTTSKSLTQKSAGSRFEPHQRAIDDARAAEIQSALIKAGYLAGSPSGHWDPASIAAMTKLQADNGWQTKLVPDSRALIKLGLGPESPTASPAPATQTTASLGATRTLASAQ